MKDHKIRVAVWGKVKVQCRTLLAIDIRRTLAKEPNGAESYQHMISGNTK